MARGRGWGFGLHVYLSELSLYVHRNTGIHLYVASNAVLVLRVAVQTDKREALSLA